MKQLKVDGVEIAYLDERKGPCVLLGHCSSASHKEWLPLIEELKGDWHVLAPDFIGYGRSDPWPIDKPFSIEALKLTTNLESFPVIEIIPNQIVTKKSSATNDKQLLSFHLRKFIFELIADIFEIIFNNLFRAIHYSPFFNSSIYLFRKL